MIHLKASAWSNSDECDFRKPVVIDDVAPVWQKPVVIRLNALCALQRGWDGYKARPVDFGTANFALRILQTIWSAGLPMPSLVPGVNGDLQIEWHTHDWDVEIHVLAPNKVEAWRHAVTDEGGDGEMITTTIDFTTIYDWVRVLAEPAVADFATAA